MNRTFERTFESTYPALIIHLLLGIAAVLTNFLILLTFSKNSALLKNGNNLTLACLAVADFIQGCGVIIYDAVELRLKSSDDLWPAWICIYGGHFVLEIGMSASIYWLFIVALQRFIAITFPLFTITNLTSKTFALWGMTVYALGFGSILVVGFNTNELQTLTRTCNLPVVFGVTYLKIKAVAGLTVTVLLYISYAGVLIGAHRGSRQLIELQRQEGAGAMRHVRRNSISSENRMNKTLTALLLAFTVFYSIPICMIIATGFIDALHFTRYVVLSLLPIGINCNSMINIFIYISRNNVLRVCILDLLSISATRPDSVISQCQELSTNL